jgi:hypothetical protein
MNHTVGSIILLSYYIAKYSLAFCQEIERTKAKASRQYMVVYVCQLGGGTMWAVGVRK